MQFLLDLGSLPSISSRTGGRLVCLDQLVSTAPDTYHTPAEIQDEQLCYRIVRADCVREE